MPHLQSFFCPKGVEQKLLMLVECMAYVSQQAGQSAHEIRFITCTAWPTTHSHAIKTGSFAHEDI